MIEDDLDEIPDISPVRLETEADEITDINPVETEEIPELLYSDRFIAVINKPAGIPMNRNYDHPEGITEMMRRAGEGIPVHRLDMETSGILVLGKTRDARRNLHNQFGRREVRKTYLAIARGFWDDRLAGIIAPLLSNGRSTEVSMEEGAKEAATAFEQIGRVWDYQGNPYSFLRVRIFSGRMHQIRAHLAHLGHAIAGDKRYGLDEDSDRFPRHLLHASELTILHPATKRKMTFTAPLPSDFPMLIPIIPSAG